MSVKKVDITELSSYIMFELLKNEAEINSSKIQLLLYYIQSWHLVYFNKNNLFDELPEAWARGPIYRSIFNQLNVIDEEKSFNDYQMKKEKLTLSKIQWEFLESILNYYGRMTFEKLVFLTLSDLPWNEARKYLAPFEYCNNLSIFIFLNNYLSVETIHY